MEEKHQRIREIMERELSCSAHEMEHVARVYNLCLRLAESEPEVDLDVLKTAALLHDIARVKEFEDKTGTVDHAVLGAEMADKILRELGYPEEKIAAVKHCIANHRYRGRSKPQSKEAKILFDADKLDAIGGVGVARSFMIAGQYGQTIYSDTPVDEYVRKNVFGGELVGGIREMSEHSPNLEFEIKFKRIPDKLFTEKAKEIAQERIEFMTRFFERLRREINGEM